MSTIMKIFTILTFNPGLKLIPIGISRFHSILDTTHVFQSLTQWQLSDSATPSVPVDCYKFELSFLLPSSCPTVIFEEQ
jgi:hypothetical protein